MHQETIGHLITFLLLIVPGGATIVMTVFKLFGFVTISWWYVVAPLAGLVILISLVSLCVVTSLLWRSEPMTKRVDSDSL